MHRQYGILLVMIAAVFWGIGGTVAKRLFELGVEVNWLVSTRLLIAGILLLLLQYSRKGNAIFTVWKQRKSAIQLLIFGLVGMLAVQYTYMASIQAGNAAVATLLQYLAPIMIIFYLVLRRLSVFTGHDAITVLLALIGCFLLLTNGSVSGLVVPVEAVIWGVLSGVALAFYTLYAGRLLLTYGSLVIVGWSMVVGGIALSFVHPPWEVDPSLFTVELILYLAFVIIFATMLTFWFYIESLHALSPQETSLLSSLEPLVAIVTTVYWLNEPFGVWQWVGSSCIIAVILLITLKRKTRKP